MRPPNLSMSQSWVIAHVVMVVWVSVDLQHIPELSQNNTSSLPRPWRICICCALIYNLHCMLHFYGVISVLQPLSFCLPSVTFKTFDSIVVPRHSWFLFHSFSLLRGMIIHDFSQRAVVLCCHHLHVTRVFITIWLNHCVEAWLLDVILKFLNVYKRVIRNVVACNWLIKYSSGWWEDRACVHLCELAHLHVAVVQIQAIDFCSILVRAVRKPSGTLVNIILPPQVLFYCCEPVTRKCFHLKTSSWQK